MVRVREIPRTAAFAWSSSINDPQIVTGTKAGAVDADFSNETVLELWDLDFGNTNATPELHPAGSVAVDSRFHAVGWSQATSSYAAGIIAGALESGSLNLWDAAKLSANSQNPLISSTSKHSGPIKTLQFNPHRDDLLASAGVKGELFITNLGGAVEPFRLGTGAARADDFDALDWNKKVPHILVTGSSGGFATVWDVRAKKESINLNNHGRKPVSAIAWDPTTPTKLATATSYDQDPAILMWDLRNSNAPERILKHHDQGILSLSWSLADPRLLLSCGKDNRTVCWNTHTGEAFGEYPIVTNWTFQTTWNPRHPGLLATASFDGKISVQTVQNTNPETAEIINAGQALDGADFFASAQSRPQGASFSLPVAPEWLKRPVSATFGFGGKLVQVSPTDGSGKASKISITSFISDPAIGEASERFEQSMQNGDFKTFCDEKIVASGSEQDKADWTVIETLISKSRNNLKQYLGFSTPDAETNGTASSQDKSIGNELDDNAFFDNADGSDNFLSTLASSKGAKNNNPFKVYSGNESEADKAITRALILGNFENALDLCLQENRLSDALVIAIAGGDKCIEKARTAYFKTSSKAPSYVRLLASFSNKNLWDMVYNIDLSEWKDAIAAICTYADDDDFSDLCEALGDRLDESSSGDESRKDASFCYLAGSKLEKVVNIWLGELKQTEKASMTEDNEHNSFFSIHATSLQDFIEKVTVFRQVTAFADDQHSSANDWKLAPLYAKYAEYADILASQGHLKTAERYLDLLPSQYPTAEIARNRVKQATRKQGAASSRTTPATTNQRGQQVISNFQPAQPSIVPVPASINNAYAPAGATAPSTKPANFIPSAAPGASPYAPAGYQQPQQNFMQPAGYGHNQPYGQTGYGGFGATPPPPRASTQSPAIPPPSQNLSNVPQWNDTPDFFGSGKPAPRRAAPTVHGPPTASPFVNQPSAPSPTNAYGAPPKASTPVPPPPKAGAPRIASPSTFAQPNTPAERPSSSVANSYAPPVGVPAPSQFQTVQRTSSPYNPPPQTGATSGRYAPNPASQPTPTPNATVPPPKSMPYAPARTSSYGAVNPMSQSTPAPTPTAPAPPPKGPPPKGTARIVVPPPSAASRNVALPSPQPSNSRPNSPAIQAPSASAAPRYPSGDRSHIPATSMPAYEAFNNEMQRIKSKAPQAYMAQVLDTEKRLNILFDHLNNSEVLTPETISKVKAVAQSVQGRQYEDATATITDLMTNQSSEGSNWMVGVKRLIMMSKATPV